MDCPFCHSKNFKPRKEGTRAKTLVYKTDSYPTVVLRYRECNNVGCGHCWRTSETIDEVLD